MTYARIMLQIFAMLCTAGAVYYIFVTVDGYR